MIYSFLDKCGLFGHLQKTNVSGGFFGFIEPKELLSGLLNPISVYFLFMIPFTLP
jgi:hypothetical protein